MTEANENYTPSFRPELLAAYEARHEAQDHLAAAELALESAQQEASAAHEALAAAPSAEAERRVAIAEKVLIDARATYMESELTVGERDLGVERVVDRALHSEREDSAERVMQAHRDLVEAGEQLIASILGELKVPAGSATSKIQRALELIPNCTAPAWVARRTALIKGTTV